MKRYFVLAGEQYYPNRWSDFIGSCDTIEEARSLAKEVVDYNGPPRYWYQIIDTETEEVEEEG